MYLPILLTSVFLGNLPPKIEGSPGNELQNKVAIVWIVVPTSKNMFKGIKVKKQKTSEKNIDHQGTKSWKDTFS